MFTVVYIVTTGGRIDMGLNSFVDSILKQIVDKNDEPKNRDCSFRLKSWPHIGWPISNEYRIVVDRNISSHSLRLQALYNGEWVEVMTYDDGYDDYGKLRPGKWVALSSQCGWTKSELERVAREATGTKLEPIIVSEIKAQ